MEHSDFVYVGQRFGKLVVEMPVSGHKVPYWQCRCDCGNAVIFSENSLVKGYKKSCGCMKSPDITGQRYGLLTVTGRSDKRAPRGNRTVPLWECRCDCGATVYKAKDTLTNPELCSCQNCASARSVQIMSSVSGYVEGTQLSRLTKKEPIGETVSGRRGVTYERKSQRWRARIGFCGKKINLGSYKTLEEAVHARKRAEDIYFKPLLEKYNWNEK